jgi:two-component system, OmpR family, phosphate regulon response regulator PhoB
VTPTTLVVQNDGPLREAAADAVGRIGHELLYAETVEEAERALASARAQALIVDLALPGESSIGLVRRLRARQQTKPMAIIVLSARGKEDDNILALEAGADDYLSLPFSARELAARLKSILRRRGHESGEKAIQIGGLRLEPLLRRATAGSRELQLTDGQFRLLQLFMTRAGAILSRAQIIEHLYVGEVVIAERSVDAHINRLRRELAVCGYRGMIETVPGLGYRFGARLCRAGLM